MQLQYHQIELLAIVETQERDTKGPIYKCLLTTNKKNLIWDVLYLTSNRKLQLKEHGPKIVFIKGIHNTVADQSHSLSMTPASIEQLRATLQQ